MSYSISAIIHSIEAIRSIKGYCTNASFSYDCLERIVNNKDYSVNLYPNCVLISLFEHEFTRLWFYGVSLDCIPQFSNTKGNKWKKPYISEIILPSSRVPNVMGQAFADSGWELLTTLRMMTRKARIPTEQITTSFCEYAIDDDLHELYDLLYCTFDSRVSHLPTFEALKESIQKNEILLTRDEKKIAAFIIVQVVGNKMRYVYQVCTRAEHRGKGYAKSLLSKAITIAGEGISFQLWVEDNNTSAIALYEKIGFESNQRRLEIYTLGKEK